MVSEGQETNTTNSLPLNKMTPSRRSSCVAGDHDSWSSRGVISRSLFLFRYLLSYVVAINSKKCPPISRILMVNVCLIFSTSFFLLTWILFFAVSAITAVVIQVSLLQHVMNIHVASSDEIIIWWVYRVNEQVLKLLSIHLLWFINDVRHDIHSVIEEGLTKKYFVIVIHWEINQQAKDVSLWNRMNSCFSL